MTSGGTNPPSPPTAPTMPVTLPTCGCGVTWETSANTLPLAVPSPAAIHSRQIVPTGSSGGSKACTIARRATNPRAPAVTTAGWTRSASQPPNGRATTVSRANPAALVPASVGVSPYPLFRYVGR